MKEESINNVPYNNFGTAVYSCGLEIVTFDPLKIHPMDILKFQGFFLHPTMVPTNVEIFALKGTKKQFEEFYPLAVNSFAIQSSLKKYGVMYEDDDTNYARAEMFDNIRLNFVPWYNKTKKNGK